MAARRLKALPHGDRRRVGLVVARFNGDIGEGLLAGAMRALREAGVAEDDVTIVSVPGAPAINEPLALPLESKVSVSRTLSF